jgi:hypothetical protein
MAVKPEQRNAQPATAAAPQATTHSTVPAAPPPKQEESTAQPAQQGGAAVAPPLQPALAQQGGAAAAPPTQADGAVPSAPQGGAAADPSKRKRSATAPEEILRVHERLKRKAVRLSASCLAAYQHNYAVPEPKEVCALNCLCLHVAVFTSRCTQALKHAEEYYRCLAMAAVVKGAVMPPQIESVHEQHHKFKLNMSEFKQVLSGDVMLKAFEMGPEVGDKRSARYEHTQALYLASFGAVPDRQLWPSINADGEMPCTLVSTAELRRLRKADEKLRRVGQGEPVLSVPEKRIKPDPTNDLPPPQRRLTAQRPPRKTAPSGPTQEEIRYSNMVRRIEASMEGSKRLRAAADER